MPKTVILTTFESLSAAKSFATISANLNVYRLFTIFRKFGAVFVLDILV
jgi:hypothetical protein